MINKMNEARRYLLPKDFLVYTIPLNFDLKWFEFFFPATVTRYSVHSLPFHSGHVQNHLTIRSPRKRQEKKGEKRVEHFPDG